MEQNKELQIFDNEEFGQVRTTTINGEPWFVGKDVAEKLGYVKARNAIYTHVDDEDKMDAPIQGDLGGTQNMIIINESGLYSLILKSKLPQAKDFKRWVTSEVLPTLRKTGTYSLQKKESNELTVIADSLLSQVSTMINGVEERINDKLDQLEHKQEELDDYYKPTHKKKLGLNSFIKSCLGDNSTKDNVERATEQLLVLLGNYEAYQEVPKDILEDVNTKALAYDICKNINISIKGIE
jgi:prophage antirepressor-like protein